MQNKPYHIQLASSGRLLARQGQGEKGTGNLGAARDYHWLSLRPDSLVAFNQLEWL
jgi:hypothetical protein